jgi:phosphoenolpyruvate carboxylase
VFREVLHHCLVHPNINVKEILENDPEAYSNADEFLVTLKAMYTSLLACKDNYIATGRLLDFIRQVGWAPLDRLGDGWMQTDRQTG